MMQYLELKVKQIIQLRPQQRGKKKLMKSKINYLHLIYFYYISFQSKIRKAEFDIEFFLEKLKTDGKKNLKKELIENDEIARKQLEQERRRSSLLYKTN